MHLLIILWTVCAILNLVTASRHSFLLTLTRIIFAPLISFIKAADYLFLK